MNKKRILLGTITILLLSTLYHGIYDHYPSFLTSLLFPTTESIWEHNKMILLAFITWNIIDKILNKIDDNVIFKDFVSSILCIILVIAIFTPVYFFILNKNDNLAVTLIIYTLSIFVSLLVTSIIKIKKSHTLETLSIAGFILLIITFSIMTYYHPDSSIFKEFDLPTHHIYIQNATF